MKKIRLTSATRNRRFMAMFAILFPGCKSLGLSSVAANPKVAAAKTSVFFDGDDVEAASSFGVW